jgi:hypothetical protein
MQPTLANGVLMLQLEYGAGNDTFFMFFFLTARAPKTHIGFYRKSQNIYRTDNLLYYSYITIAQPACELHTHGRSYPESQYTRSCAHFAEVTQITNSQKSKKWSRKQE